MNQRDPYRIKRTQEFLRVLFDQGEHSNFARHNGDTSINPMQAIDHLDLRCQSVCINPIDPKVDHERPPPDRYKARRAIANIVSFRSFLIEFDEGQLEEQLKYIESIGMPHSASVYSGKRSIHFLIRLADPLQGLSEYRKVSERLHKAVAKTNPRCGPKVDPSTNGPLARIRYPYHLRWQTKKEQELISVKTRIPNGIFFDWLDDRGAFEIEEPEMPSGLIVPISSPSGLKGHTKNLLMFGAMKGERNSSVFKAACDYAHNGILIQKAIADLSSIPNLVAHDFTLDEIRRAIESAYRTVTGKTY
jgi:hypothetical protein